VNAAVQHLLVTAYCQTGKGTAIIAKTKHTPEVVCSKQYRKWYV